MICREFPDLDWLKKQAEDRFSNRQGWKGARLTTGGWPTVILNVPTKKTFRDNIRGPLSLFTNLKGSSSVHCGNQKAIIHPGFFYITNHDQHYTLDIDQSSGSETFNIHFGEYWADQAFQSITKSADKLLDEAFFTPPGQRIELYNKLHFRDEVFNQLILDIGKNADQKLPEEEKLYELLLHLLRQNSQTRKIETQIPALKNTTRKEIIKRLTASTDYIYSFYHKDLSLDELAEVACLSKFHFLRLFKNAFGKTPYHFINEVKVEQAKMLLKDRKLEVTHISRELGFVNVSSFSRMFFNHTGLYPTQHR
jgi:AraC family transcriptional regulator